MIGIAIGNRIGKASKNWTQPIITALSISNLSDTSQRIVATITGTDFTGLSWEKSTDCINWSVDGTSLTGTYDATGLTNNTRYYYRVRAYKGTKYSSYSPIKSRILHTLDTGLLAYWKFNESTGNAADSVGSNTLVNSGGSYEAAKIENGVSLGTSNTTKYLSVATDFGMTYLSSKSISGWVKMKTQPDEGQNMAIFSLMFATNPGSYVCLRYTKASGIYQVNLSNTGAYNVTLTTDQWFHFVVTWDQVNNVCKLYINGLLVLTDACFTGDYSAYTSQLQVGRLLTVFYASAVVDELGIWNEILLPEEITDIYNSGDGQTYPLSSTTITLPPVKLLANIAWCWFNSPKPTYSAAVNKTWLNLVHTGAGDGGQYCQYVLEMNNVTGAVTATKVGSVYQDDDHNEGSIIVRKSDNKLVTAYAEHTLADAPIRVRISTNAYDATAWGDEISVDPYPAGYVYTYANLFQVVNGDLYLFFRVHNTDPLASWAFVKSTDGGANWGSPTQVTDFEGTGPTYHRIYQDTSNLNIIHFIGSPHPNEGLASCKVIHYYFNTALNKFYKSDGTDITALLPIDYTETTAIFTSTDPEQAWVEDLIVDSNGYPRALLTHYSDIDSAFQKKDLYYTEWTGFAWTTPYKIHQSCNKNIAAANTNGEISYPPLAIFDRSNPDRIFASKEISDGGQLEIYELIRSAYNSFSSTKKTTSSYDQWRPISTDAPNYNLFWLNKRTYTTYKSFAQDIMTMDL